jgi:hypothetical protein
MNNLYLCLLTNDIEGFKTQLEHTKLIDYVDLETGSTILTLLVRNHDFHRFIPDLRNKVCIRYTRIKCKSGRTPIEEFVYLNKHQLLYNSNNKVTETLIFYYRCLVEISGMTFVKTHELERINNYIKAVISLHILKIKRAYIDEMC